MPLTNYLTLSHLRKLLVAITPRFQKIEKDIANIETNYSTKEYVDEAASEAVAEEVTAIETEISGLDDRVTALESVTVDDAMSTTSTNPVQNKVIYSAIQGKADASSLAAVATSGSYNDLSNKPTFPVQSVNGKTGAVVLDAADVGAAPAITEVTVTTAGAVSQALDPGKIYHFTGALSSLTITLNAAEAGEVAQYHFDFISPSTPVTLILPSTVVMPASFSLNADTRYEIDILNGYGVAQRWAVSANA